MKSNCLHNCTNLVQSLRNYGPQLPPPTYENDTDELSSLKELRRDYYNSLRNVVLLRMANKCTRMYIQVKSS